MSEFEPAMPCALAIGNFDGVHLGHQALMAAAVAYAKESALLPAVLTFDPHPTNVVAPQRVPLALCSLPERIRLLKAAGASEVYVEAFTHELAALTPREFVLQILKQKLNAQAVFVGENFCFGAQKSGTPEVLRALGEELGFTTNFLSPVRYRHEIVSSSAIRRYLSAGRISRANRLLGRCFSLDGPVVSGHGIGSKQTVPTLNLRPTPQQIVPRGVYVTETFEIPTGRRWQSITNAGVRPTFGGEELTVETFLLSPFEEPTPSEIRVEFRRFIRAERQFPDPASLKAQIMRDVGRAQIYWRRVSQLSKFRPVLA
jgi:riboflavin kinase / FMN adenylyltransferase